MSSVLVKGEGAGRSYGQLTHIEVVPSSQSDTSGHCHKGNGVFKAWTVIDRFWMDEYESEAQRYDKTRGCRRIPSAQGFDDGLKF